jgi:hypothetical protein
MIHGCVGSFASLQKCNQNISANFRCWKSISYFKIWTTLHIMKILLVLMWLKCQLFCYWILTYFLPICRKQYESRCAWKLSLITHPTHMFSSLQFGGKNPVTWLQSSCYIHGWVCDRPVAFKAGMNKVIYLPFFLFGVLGDMWKWVRLQSRPH